MGFFKLWVWMAGGRILSWSFILFRGRGLLEATVGFIGVGHNIKYIVICQIHLIMLSMSRLLLLPNSYFIRSEQVYDHVGVYKEVRLIEEVEIFFLSVKMGKNPIPNNLFIAFVYIYS